jgi:ZIP family zinc transporter
MYALAAGLFTWGMTALGAAPILIGRSPKRRTLDVLLGFSAGVMLAASFWSLLAPAVEFATRAGQRPWVAPVLGFAVGGLGLWALDKVTPHLHSLGKNREIREGPKTRLPRTTLLIFAITIHKIPEGFALGVAMAAAAIENTPAALGAATALALGLGLQSVPEGLAVAVPLRREGWSRARSFWYGQLAGSVGPFAALIGAFVGSMSTAVLPYVLAFAAGAMVFVVIEELIPESQRAEHSDVAVLATLLGFMVMTALDIGLT